MMGIDPAATKRARVYVASETRRVCGDADRADVLRSEIETALTTTFGAAYLVGACDTIGAGTALDARAGLTIPGNGTLVEQRARHLAFAQQTVACAHCVDAELYRLFWEHERTIVLRDELAHAIERVFVFAYNFAEITGFRDPASVWLQEVPSEAPIAGGLFLIRAPIGSELLKFLRTVINRGLRIGEIDALLAAGLSRSSTVETVDLAALELPTQLPTPLELLEPHRFLTRTGCFCGGTGRWWQGSTCSHCKGTGRKLCDCATARGSCSKPS